MPMRKLLGGFHLLVLGNIILSAHAHSLTHLWAEVLHLLGNRFLPKPTPHGT